MFILFILQVNAQEFTIGTYNIRYDNLTDTFNNWNLRKQYLVNQLKEYSPDIFGIQEGLRHQTNYLDSCLDAYSFIGVGRDDGKTKGEYSAIFVDTTKLRIVQGNTFWLSETPDQISVGWDASMERICTYALIEDKLSGHRFWVFNTHFDHRGQEARNNSALLIMNKIHQLNSENLPVLVMGDLNAKPNDDPITKFNDILKDSKAIASQLSGPEGTFNGFDKNHPLDDRIDYIFVSEQWNVLEYNVPLEFTNRNRFISDHLPVIVTLKF